MSQYEAPISQTFRMDFAILGEKVPTLNDIKAVVVTEYLKAYGFNQSRVAEKLGITRTTLRSICAKYNIRSVK